MPSHTKTAPLWSRLGTRLLPFADAASPELPLGRLLRLSLFQISVGIALVLLVGTLNRIMIVELKVSASLVAAMVALPLLFAPLRALVGFRSDNHRSQLGWRRVPYIWMGTLLQFGGLAIMPFALLVLAGAGQSASAPVWVGQAGAAIAFLMVGAGMHTTQTVGLALATDLAPDGAQARVVGFMYVMLLLGSIGSAFVFSHALRDYSPGALIRVIQAAAVATLVLNVVAVWKQEARSARYKPGAPVDDSFRAAWHSFKQGAQAQRRLWSVAIGSAAFTMQDVLLEPYGGEIMGLAVAESTRLSATLALGGLIGFATASRVLGRGADPFKMASLGACLGLPAFAAVIAAAPLGWLALFTLGTFLIGLGGGLFAHGTLTSTMQLAPKHQIGLALGAWGAVQATAAGVAMALGGLLRDLFTALAGPLAGYTGVYALELLLLLAALYLMWPLMRKREAAA